MLSPSQSNTHKPRAKENVLSSALFRDCATTYLNIRLTRIRTCYRQRTLKAYTIADQSNCHLSAWRPHKLSLDRPPSYQNAPAWKQTMTLRRQSLRGCNSLNEQQNSDKKQIRTQTGRKDSTRMILSDVYESPPSFELVTTFSWTSTLFRSAAERSTSERYNNSLPRTQWLYRLKFVNKKNFTQCSRWPGKHCFHPPDHPYPHFIVLLWRWTIL